LHARIDRLIETGAVVPPGPPANDPEFLRRITLDLTGMPPSAEELKDFLADPSPGKRADAIDRLLNGPLFTRHLATTLDVMLMERRPGRNVPDDDWRGYLYKAARENRPLNALMKEILAADGADAGPRPAARFYLDRGCEPHLVTRDVGRTIFGRDMQCAQCHNHPLIEDYRQSDYHGLLAFLSPGYALTRKEGGKDRTDYAERSGSDLTFDSVFVKDDKHRTGPRLPGGVACAEPVFPPGEEYRTGTAAQGPPAPRFSRRALLAALATDGTNRAFNENLANRLWALMMGRGLVHPVDLHHPSNPPSHPELLRLLGEEFAATRFDAQAFLREIALTRAYQRSVDPPHDGPPLPAGFEADVAETKRRSEAQQAAAESAREEFRSAVKAWDAAESAFIPAAASEDQALAKHSETAKKRDLARKAFDDATAKAAARRGAAKALAEAAAKAQEAVKSLPGEKDLAAAAQKFVDRSNALAAEVKALEKVGADREAGLKKAEDQVVSAAKAVEAARASAAPLREAVRKKEETALVARRTANESRTEAERTRNRLELLGALGRRDAVARQVAETREAVARKREALDTAQAAVEECDDLMSRRRAAGEATAAARLAAEAARDDARAALVRHKKAVAAVANASAATDAAARLLPDDPTLTDAGRVLREKADALQSASAAPKARLDTASAALKKADDAVAAEGEAFASLAREKAGRTRALEAARVALSAEATRAKALDAEAAAANEELAALMSNACLVAQLKPLTPEQMCWSVLKVTGVYDRQRRAEEAELDKTKPLTGDARRDPAQVLARAYEVEQRTFAKLKGHVGAFVAVYGAGAGQPQNDFFATADQALFTANGGAVNGWIKAAGGNVSDRIARETDPGKAAEVLYTTILSRPPSPDESADVARALAGRATGDTAAAEGLVWGLLTSAEFRFNH
jgi:hypothetical protein